jgi:hypothetical protein
MKYWTCANSPCHKLNWLYGRLATLCVLESLAHCSLFPRPARPNPGALVKTELNPDKAVAKIASHFRQFERTISQRSFQEATTALKRAAKAIRTAPKTTQGHPDFEDLVLRLRRSRKHFHNATEAERTIRQQEAIDDIIVKGNNMMGECQTLQWILETTIAQQGQLKKLAHFVDQFDELEKTGRFYYEDETYAVHAAERATSQDSVHLTQTKAKRWFSATKDALARIEKGVTLLNAHKKSDNLPDTELQEAKDAFESCIGHLQDFTGDPEFNKTLKLISALGTQTISQSKKSCEHHRALSQTFIEQVRWKQSVEELLKGIQVAAAHASEATSLTESMQAYQEGTDAFASCAKYLNETRPPLGFQKERRFNSPWGTMQAKVLLRTCETKTKAWLVEREKSESLVQGEKITLEAYQLNEKLNERQKKEHGDDSMSAWRKLSNDSKTCVSRAQKLLNQPKAKISYLFKISDAPKGLTLGQAKKLCQKIGRATLLGIKSTKSTQKRIDYAKNYKNDARQFILERGLPLRVDVVEGGIILIYAAGKKRTPPKRFGFDTQGDSFDFEEKWREQIIGLIENVANKLSAIPSLPPHQAKVNATVEALEALNECVVRLPKLDKLPGFSAKVKIQTPIAKGTSKVLLKTCRVKQKKLQKEQTVWKWRVEFESLAQSVSSDFDRFSELKRDNDPQDKLEQLDVVLKGLGLCTKRIPSLMRDKNVDKKYRYETSMGKVNLKTFAKGCANTHKLVEIFQRRVKALNTFIESCTGDEIERAKEAGLPLQVLHYAQGRMWIYTKGKKRQGGKSKKPAAVLAFDVNGEEIDAKTLTGKVLRRIKVAQK